MNSFTMSNNLQILGWWGVQQINLKISLSLKSKQFATMELTLQDLISFA